MKTGLFSMKLPLDIKDILPILERIPGWKRLVEAPKRIDELETRIKALEERPALPICEKCGIGHRRLDREEPMAGPVGITLPGARVKVYKCDHCGLETRNG